MALDDATRELIDGKNFATVATINPDGGPQTSVVWVALEDGAVVFSATRARRKVRNLLRDPRISLTVYATDDPYRSVDIRGTAEVIDDPEKSLPVRLSRKYRGEDPPPEPADVDRVIVRVVPSKVTGFAGARGRTR